jgi:hypothetical protein
MINTKYYWNGNEIGGAYGMHKGEEKCTQGFDGKNLRERATWNTYI